MDGTVDRTQLDHLLADVPDEPAVGSPAGGGKLGLNAGYRVDRGVQRFDEAPSLGDEREPGQGPLEVELEPVPRQHRLETPLQVLHGAGGAKAKIEEHRELAGDHIIRTRAGVDVGDLPGSRREVLVALVPARRRQLGKSGSREMNGVSSE